MIIKKLLIRKSDNAVMDSNTDEFPLIIPDSTLQWVDFGIQTAGRGFNIANKYKNGIPQLKWDGKGIVSRSQIEIENDPQNIIQKNMAIVQAKKEEILNKMAIAELQKEGKL